MFCKAALKIKTFQQKEHWTNSNIWWPHLCHSSTWAVLVLRRGIPFQRVIYLWQRESKRKSPKNVVRVRYLVEECIDSGALSREFFADTIPQIGNSLFPGGTPVDSTLYVLNETFRTTGEIVATSSPTNFLDPVVFDTLVNLDGHGYKRSFSWQTSDIWRKEDVWHHQRRC